MVVIKFMSICAIALKSMTQNTSDEKSTLAQIMASPMLTQN